MSGQWPGGRPTLAPTDAFIDAIVGERKIELHEAHKAELASAWRDGSPEFSTALYLAIMFENDGPLNEYLASEKPLGRAERQGLIVYNEWLKARLPLKQPRGRPKRSPELESIVVTAERFIARYVADRKAAWCEEHGRKRVSETETSKWIDEGIRGVRQLGLSDQTIMKISKDNIRSALKTGRFVVP